MVRFVVTLLLLIAIFQTVGLKAHDLLPILNAGIDALRNGQSFHFVDLQLTDKERLLFDALKVKRAEIFDHFEALENIPTVLPAYLKLIGNDDAEVIDAVSSAVYRIAVVLLQAAKKERAWVSLRATVPNCAFDLPRWHTDGYYYFPQGEFEDRSSKLVFKFVAVLKGPPTLFYSLSPQARKEFEAHEEDRAYLANWLKMDGMASGASGQGALFIAGNHYWAPAAIHSEPKMDQPRLFFSIVPGDAEEIAQVEKKKKRESKRK